MKSFEGKLNMASQKLITRDSALINHHLILNDRIACLHHKKVNSLWEFLHWYGVLATCKLCFMHQCAGHIENFKTCSLSQRIVHGYFFICRIWAAEGSLSERWVCFIANG